MKTEFVTYKTLPPELAAMRDKAFAHSILTPEAKAMDDLGEYTALFMDDKFIGAVNTITNQKPIELWSKNEVNIEEPYAFFCRGFIGENIRLGLGSHILLLLSISVISSDPELVFYTTCREQHKSVVQQLLQNGYIKQTSFHSSHQKEETNLSLFEFTASKNQANEYKTKLISYLQQKLS